MFEVEGELPLGVVNEMSLAWRNMSKTVYELKKQDVYPPDLKRPCRSHCLPTATGHATGSAEYLQEGAAQEDSSSLTVDEVACMFVDEDMSDTADDVDIVSVTCSCADCVKKDGEKQRSVAASCPLPTIQQDIRIPCALRGGQKKRNQGTGSASEEEADSQN